MPLSPGELGRRLADALTTSGATVAAETPFHKRPLLLHVGLGSLPLALRVFIWRIEHGGATRSPSEYRVQTTRPGRQPFLVDDGRRTLLLGHHDALDVFAAWDVRAHPNPGSSSSLQVSLNVLEEARETGFTSSSRQIAAGQELVMAFRPDAIVTYLEVVERLQVVGEQRAIPAVEAVTKGQEITDALLFAGGERPREIREIAALVRDRRFRSIVLRVYGERCAFCGIGVGIVQAAHIQAVADDGPDVLHNGIAACPNHHAAFDRGLVLIEDDGRIVVNEARAIALGIDADDRGRLRQSLHDRLLLPSDPDLRPDPIRLREHRSKWGSRS